MDFATVLKSIVDTLGSTVLLPVFIFLFAVILGAKAGRAFRAAVTIGVAFVGINLVVGLMWGALADVSQAMVTNAGITRDIVDVGWPAAAAVAFATDVGLWVIPIGLVVNFALLLPGVTKLDSQYGLKHRTTDGPSLVRDGLAVTLIPSRIDIADLQAHIHLRTCTNQSPKNT